MQSREHGAPSCVCKAVSQLAAKLMATRPEDMEWRNYSVAIFRGHSKVIVRGNRQEA